MDIIENLKFQWRTGSMLIKIVFINVGVFVLLHLIGLILSFTPFSGEGFLHWIELPSDVATFIRQPWTVVTYMFSQYAFFHLLFNMLWLYWFGVIFLFSDSGKRLLALYLYGGVGGAALFMAAYTFMGDYGWLIGSSASVIAVVMATAIIHPDYKMGILFLGEISLKWIAIVTIAIDLMSVSGANGGGHIAHVGGALVGAIYAGMLKKGVDITRPFNALVDWFVNLWNRLVHPHKEEKARPFDYTRYRKPSSGQPRQAASSSAPKSKPAFDEDRLNSILEKIKKSGYGALTAEEKQILFDESRKIK